jgi:hypothetical protein
MCHGCCYRCPINYFRRNSPEGFHYNTIRGTNTAYRYPGEPLTFHNLNDCVFSAESIQFIMMPKFRVLTGQKGKQPRKVHKGRKGQGSGILKTPHHRQASSSATVTTPAASSVSTSPLSTESPSPLLPIPQPPPPPVQGLPPAPLPHISPVLPAATTTGCWQSTRESMSRTVHRIVQVFLPGISKCGSGGTLPTPNVPPVTPVARPSPTAVAPAHDHAPAPVALARAHALAPAAAAATEGDAGIALAAPGAAAACPDSPMAVDEGGWEDAPPSNDNGEGMLCHALLQPCVFQPWLCNWYRVPRR